MSDVELLPPEGFRQRGPLPTGTRLLLIRHAESVANERGLAGGPIGDGGLTDLGRAQARALAARLALTDELAGAAALYTSTLPRAIETGDIVFRAINATLASEADEALCELGVGEADGLSWSEIAARYEPVDWNVNPSAVNVPGGESLDAFYERCVGAMERLIDRHPHQLVVLVVHGGFIEQAMKYYQRLDSRTRLQPRIEHCSMTEIEYDGDRRRLLRYNDLAPVVVVG